MLKWESKSHVICHPTPASHHITHRFVPGIPSPSISFPLPHQHPCYTLTSRSHSSLPSFASLPSPPFPPFPPFPLFTPPLQLRACVSGTFSTGSFNAPSSSAALAFVAVWQRGGVQGEVKEWTVVRGWSSNITVQVKNTNSSSSSNSSSYNMDALLLLLPPLFPSSHSTSSNSSFPPSTTISLDGCTLPTTRFVACLALALPTPTGMSPLPQGFVCYYGSSLEDDAPKGHFTFEEGRGAVIEEGRGAATGTMLHVYPGSGVRANVTFRSHEHAAIAGVEVETMHMALRGVCHQHIFLLLPSSSSSSS
jgi:hypothetical protein